MVDIITTASLYCECIRINVQTAVTQCTQDSLYWQKPLYPPQAKCLPVALGKNASYSKCNNRTWSRAAWHGELFQ